MPPMPTPTPTLTPTPKPLRRVTPSETAEARSAVAPYTIRTPIVPLEYVRPDAPDLRIYLKLETFQPSVRSFKVRGAANAVASLASAKSDANDETGAGVGAGVGAEAVVTASAGNMGRALAHLCRSTGRRCIVVVPDSAPSSKVESVASLGAEVVRVPYDEWWAMIDGGDCSSVSRAVGMLGVGTEEEEEGDQQQQYAFVHPVCDSAVVAGNSTCGIEILEDVPDVDAILVPYGGGGLSCGIGSAVWNEFESEREKRKKEENEAVAKSKVGPDMCVDVDRRSHNKCAVISCEPETAAPMALSKECGAATSFQEHYEPSFCDGCGGKAVLAPMWPLANEVVDSAVAVPLQAVEAGVWALHELNGVVAEGAGGVAVGAAMLCPLERLGKDASSWKKVVCVVSGAGINRSKLLEIIHKFDSANDVVELSKRLNWCVRGSPSYLPMPSTGKNASSENPIISTNALCDLKKMTVMSEDEVLEKLPMHRCIDAAQEALVALSTGKGSMPLRQVNKLPVDEIGKPGYLVSMPSYFGGYAACKLITVYPQNGGSGYSSHQGIVALFGAKNHGELLLLADAHAITSQRTAAASAAATRVLAKKRDCRVLALLGTGEQARSHFVSMLETGLPIDTVRIWGRDKSKAERLARDLRERARTYPWRVWTGRQSPRLDLHVCDCAQECVRSADVICTLVPSLDPVLCGDWVKSGAHINAVGACLPTQRELDGICVGRAALYCDSREACFAEAGDVVLALKEGAIDKDHLRGEIGSVLNGELVGRENDKQITIFKSLGIALEDLTAAKAIYEHGS